MEFHINRCNGAIAPNFENIEMKGYFSRNTDGSIKFDCSQLCYFKERDDIDVHFNLNDGLESARQYLSCKSDKHLNTLTKWIQMNHEKIQSNPTGGDKWLQPNFVCRRFVIEKLLKTPFCKQIYEGWIICAAKWRGTIYLSSFDTKQYETFRETVQPQDFAMEFWGHKFEQYMVSDTADGPPNVEKPLDQNTRFSSIFQCRLGNHTLLYSAGIDAVCSDETFEDPLPLDELKFIELKLIRIANTYQRHTNLRKHVSLKVWGQCAPVGINKIVCGLRDEEGIVEQLKTYSLDDWINMSTQHWNPSTSMNFCNDFLTHMAETVEDDCNETIYKFERRPDSPIIQMSKVSPDSKYCFLPRWFTKNAV